MVAPDNTPGESLHAILNCTAVHSAYRANEFGRCTGNLHAIVTKVRHQRDLRLIERDR